MVDPILPTACDLHGKCRDLLHAADLRHGTGGFTSPPKEGMLRIFFARKIGRFQPGLNPRTWVPEASMLTTRPLKPLTVLLTPHTSTVPMSMSTIRYDGVQIRNIACDEGGFNFY
jgi:hypothetical protein